MTRKLAILGASGHGKVVAEIAEMNSYEVVFFDDAFPQKNSIEHWPVLGKSIDLLKIINDFEIMIAIGDNRVRYQKQTELYKAGAKFPVLIHPSATVSEYAAIGDGTVVMAGAVINAFAQVMCGSIINTCAVVEHDCKVYEFSHVSPNATLAGGCEVGKCTWLGAGTVVRQLVIVGSNVVIGAGSVVINNIPDDVVAVGVPANIKKGK